MDDLRWRQQDWLDSTGAVPGQDHREHENGLQGGLIGYAMATCTIEKAASEHRWEEAVLSLCNALEALPAGRRLALARELVERCESAKALFMAVASVGQPERIAERGLQLQAARSADLEPVDVQLESANEILRGLEARRNGQDQQSVVKLASAIFAVQILVWLQGNPEDVTKWRRGEVADHGVYDDARANLAGEALWKQAHAMILRERPFRRRSEDFIYREWPVQSLVRSWLHAQVV